MSNTNFPWKHMDDARHAVPILHEDAFRNLTADQRHAIFTRVFIPQAQQIRPGAAIKTYNLTDAYTSMRRTDRAPWRIAWDGDNPNPVVRAARQTRRANVLVRLQTAAQVLGIVLASIAAPAAQPLAAPVGQDDGAEQEAEAGDQQENVDNYIPHYPSADEDLARRMAEGEDSPGSQGSYDDGEDEYMHGTNIQGSGDRIGQGGRLPFALGRAATTRRRNMQGQNGRMIKSAFGVLVSDLPTTVQDFGDRAGDYAKHWNNEEEPAGSPTPSMQRSLTPEDPLDDLFGTHPSPYPTATAAGGRGRQNSPERPAHRARTANSPPPVRPLFGDQPPPSAGSHGTAGFIRPPLARFRRSTMIPIEPSGNQLQQTQPEPTKRRRNSPSATVPPTMPQQTRQTEDQTHGPGTYPPLPFPGFAKDADTTASVGLASAMGPPNLQQPIRRRRTGPSPPFPSFPTDADMVIAPTSTVHDPAAPSAKLKMVHYRDCVWHNGAPQHVRGDYVPDITAVYGFGGKVYRMQLNHGRQEDVMICDQKFCVYCVNDDPNAPLDESSIHPQSRETAKQRTHGLPFVHSRDIGIKTEGQRVTYFKGTSRSWSPDYPTLLGPLLVQFQDGSMTLRNVKTMTCVENECDNCDPKRVADFKARMKDLSEPGGKEYEKQMAEVNKGEERRKANEVAHAAQEAEERQGKAPAVKRRKTGKK